MTLLEVERLAVSYGPRPALSGVDLSVAEGETVCVLGPSGGGKSTLLRAVAGLAEPDAGTIRLAGRDQAGVPAHRRGLGLMFQDHQLFPQRDVGGNVAFGLRMRRVGRAERRRRVAELLELVGLPGAERRRVSALSGGEQQRVALARALAPSPRLLMLDEPLGRLDRDLRERLVVELRQLFRRLGTTVLAVTHDQGEAFALADRVVVMREGRIAQAGSPAEVWGRPADAFVARFLGFRNLAAGRVGTGGTADTDWGPVPVPEGTPPGPCRLLIRPSGVRFLPPDAAASPGSPGALPATVRARTFRGDHVLLLLAPASGPPLEAACPLRAAPAEGERVGLAFDPSEVVLLPLPDAADSGEPDVAPGKAPGPA
ncbi:ABC transporter ATP-binding protein [Streptomyces sp. DSM 44917]|uniref:ABC transporter ATP-binding protein n=1 Tax=Streptomyces boetiae TaxID=3075541 RepID=A0ABU2L9C6_9ACTN|nr:ABC transporter ATP-binding protein [Streptomyces sp. DSM 44917]MDT0308178.1 ABC transporter ATP-binding protein [Streptomyces sp. DSM 44917]